MKNEQFDFACSRTFREGLPNLAVDYRASDTFAGPPSRRRSPSRNLFADQERDALLQELMGVRSSCDEWKRRAIAAEAELERLQAQLKSARTKHAENFTGISELTA
jgi:hypothetical protein